jgi:hypothetical protein
MLSWELEPERLVTGGLLGEVPSAATPAEVLLFSKRGIIAHANGSLYGMILDHICSFCFSLSVKWTCYIFSRYNTNLTLHTDINDTSLVAGGRSGDKTRFSVNKWKELISQKINFPKRKKVRSHVLLSSSQKKILLLNPPIDKRI